MANTSNLDLVKPAGTDHALISVINSNMDKVDAYAGKVNTSLAGVEDGLAIVATGNTHAAITAGQFVYVKEHNTLPEGLYTASSNIAANATLSTTNLTADSKGGLNALSDQIGSLEDLYNEAPIGNYNGATIYRKRFTFYVGTLTNNTDKNIGSVDVVPNNIMDIEANLVVTNPDYFFNCNNNLSRLWVNASKEVHILQTIGSFTDVSIRGWIYYTK